METQITKANFSEARKEFISINHAADLAPFFAIQEAERAKDIPKEKNPKIWMWDNERTVNKCQQIVWQLTIDWKAWRPVPIKNPEKFNPKMFHEEVIRCVTKLATVFNKYRITALRDLKSCDRDKYKKIVSHIEDGIMCISKTKPTKKVVQPMIGSKVMHHFFPTIVPVFDNAWISSRVLRLRSFKDFLKSKGHGWILKDYGEPPRMQEYHHYLAYCAQQICDTNKHDLDDLRQEIAKLYIDVFPYSLVKNGKRSLMWKLDGKLAEYCLVGATY